MVYYYYVVIIMQGKWNNVGIGNSYYCLGTQING